MIPEKEHSNVFNAKLITEKQALGVIFRIYSNRIFHVIIPRFTKVKFDIIEEGLSFIKSNGGGKYYNIFEFNSFSDVEPEIREWGADLNGNHHTISDAIVINNLSQKIIADFYLKINKPKMPTKVFYSMEKAIQWTFTQMQEHPY